MPLEENDEELAEELDFISPRTDEHAEWVIHGDQDLEIGPAMSLEDFGFSNVNVIGELHSQDTFREIFKILDRYEVDEESVPLNVIFGRELLEALEEIEENDINHIQEFGGLYAASSNAFPNREETPGNIFIDIDSRRPIESFEEEIAHYKSDCYGWLREVNRALDNTSHDSVKENGDPRMEAVYDFIRNGLTDISSYKIMSEYGKAELAESKVLEDLELDEANLENEGHVDPLILLFGLYSHSLPEGHDSFGDVRGKQREIAKSFGIDEEYIEKTEEVFTFSSFPPSAKDFYDKFMEGDRLAKKYILDSLSSQSDEELY